MKKFTLLFGLLGSFGISYAMQTVDLNKSAYSCSGVTITQKSSPSWMANSCKNAHVKLDKEVISGINPSAVNPEVANSDALDVDAPKTVMLERVSFSADDGTVMKCYFINDKLEKCKAKVKKVSLAASPTKANASH